LTEARTFANLIFAMMILAPYFGDVKRFGSFADTWLNAARRYRDGALVGFIGDNPAPGHSLLCSAKPFSDCIRPGHPFDVKGALICDALGKIDPAEGALIIDLDALLMANPAAVLADFAADPIAMPADHGALIFFRSIQMDAPFADVTKHCAGVMWFGPSPLRAKIPALYRAAWHELAALPRFPWSPPFPHLLEQYAWTLVNHRLGGATLPASMNWSSRFFGPCPGAVIEHDYGHGKWNGDKAPANS
jgi:hypothetical protein